MTIEIFLRYIHFISIFTIVATLSIEFVLLKKEMTRSEIARLAKIDALYGIAALSLVGAGITLWLGGFGKPAIFYSRNYIFLTKIFLFLMIGILSIKPTFFFIKQQKGNPDETIRIPSAFSWMLRTELVLLVLIPLLAGLMSHGIGFF